MLPINMQNYSEKLKELWLEDPTLSKNEFFEVAKKLFNLIDDDNKKFINLNKRWCTRFYKKLVSTHNEESQSMLVEKQTNTETTENSYDLFSEP